MKKTKRTEKEHNKGDGKISEEVIGKYHETGERRDQ